MGTHKTGTSSLQNFLHANRAPLRKQGLAYLVTPRAMGPPRHAHHMFVDAIARSGQSTGRDDLLSAYMAEVSAAYASSERVLFSSERFWRQTIGGTAAGWDGRRMFLERLAEVLRGFDVQIHVFFRPQDALVQSMHRGAVMRGKKRPVDGRWVTDAAGAEEERPSNYLFILNYHRNLSLCADVFGRENVFAHLYDGKKRGAEGLASMMARLGFHGDVAGMATAEKHSYSLPDELVQFFSHVIRPEDDRERVRHLRDHVTTWSRMPDSRETVTALFRTGSVRFPVLAEANVENERLRAEFFPEVEGPLFGRPVETSLEIRVPRDPDALAAHAAAYRRRALRNMGLER